MTKRPPAASLRRSTGRRFPENGSALPDLEDEAKREWYKYTLAQLRAFTRKYHAPAAALANRLENELYAEEAVAKDIRAALVLSLHP